MKTCYDKWGKRGFLNNFIVKEFNSCTTNTLVDGSYIFKDTQFPQFDNSIDTVIHWYYPLDSLKTGIGMFQDCVNLTTFNVDLEKLENGSYMFYNTNLANFNSKLDSLVTASYMFRGCKNLISFDSKLDKLETGTGMFFECEKLAEFNIPLSRLMYGSYMFSGCKSLKKFDVDISSITSFLAMFDNCSNLETFIGDLSRGKDCSYTFRGCTKLKNLSDANGGKLNLNSLTNGRNMFSGCYGIKNFDIPLPNFEEGVGMFHNSSLETFTSKIGTNFQNGRFMFAGCEVLREVEINTAELVLGNNMFFDCVNLSNLKISNLDKLVSAVRMFKGCSKLTNITKDGKGDSTVDLSSLKNGNEMFDRCSGLGKNFQPNLANLLNGQYMFTNCKLDTETIKSIANTIKNVNGLKDGTTITDETFGSVGTIIRIIDICIDKDEPNSIENNYFESIVDKGWTVHVHKFIPLDKIPQKFMLGDEIQPKQFYGKYLEVSEANATHRLEIKNEKGEIIGVKFVILIGGSHVYGKTDGGEICSDATATKIGYQKYVDEADAIEKLNLKAIKK